eukprot:6515092-Prymnesium_polylepis.1
MSGEACFGCELEDGPACGPHAGKGPRGGRWQHGTFGTTVGSPDQMGRLGRFPLDVRPSVRPPVRPSVRPSTSVCVRPRPSASVRVLPVRPRPSASVRY